MFLYVWCLKIVIVLYFRLPPLKGGSVDLTGKLGCWFPLIKAGWLARQLGWRRGFGLGTVTSRWSECKKTQYPKVRLLDSLEQRQFTGTNAHGTDYLVWLCGECLSKRTCRYSCGGGYMVGTFVTVCMYDGNFSRF